MTQNVTVWIPARLYANTSTKLLQGGDSHLNR